MVGDNIYILVKICTFMVTITTNKKSSSGGGLLLFVAVLLMIGGWAMESSEYNVPLGAMLFTIGFWLFMIPLIILGVILIIILVLAVATTK